MQSHVENNNLSDVSICFIYNFSPFFWGVILKKWAFKDVGYVVRYEKFTNVTLINILLLLLFILDSLFCL
jgi:hypothetical protein